MINMTLKYATYDGSSWTTSTVDSAGNVGQFSLAVDSSGDVHISYFDYTNEDLKYAISNGSSWDISTVDSVGDVGRVCSMAVDSNGDVHISYWDMTNDALKYATYDGSSWLTSIVDTGVSHSSLAVDSSGDVHISYLNMSANQDLKYATYDGGSWTTSTVDNVVSIYFLSLAVDSSGDVHISYYDATNKDLKYAILSEEIVRSWSNTTVVDSEGLAYWSQSDSLAVDSSGNVHISYCDVTNWATGLEVQYATYDGSTWTTSTVDGSASNVATSLAVDSSGDVHISYYDYTTTVANADLKYATYDGSSWTNTTVASNINGEHSSLAVGSSGDVHISYLDNTNWDLKYATYDGSSWTTSTVDSEGFVGQQNSIAVDSSGDVHISYYDNTNQDLKYATFDGGSWTTSIVDSDANSAWSDGTSLAVDSSGNVHISYHDNTNWDLKYATYDGSSWTTSTVDSEGFVGQHSSLAVDSSGNVYISYYDHTINAHSLKFATYDGNSWTTSIIPQGEFQGGPQSSSLAVDSSGDVHISYYSSREYLNGTQWRPILKYAKFSDISSSVSANEITVQFGDYGNVTGTVVDDSTITVTSPQGPSSGEVVDITLWDWNGTGYVLNSAFTYVNPDIDGDGVQNALDDCPEVAGNSTIDQIGCPDSDGDGYSDSGDSFPSNPSEWSDGDGDGIGDNGDEYPFFANHNNSDGDSFIDAQDDFPTDSTQWSDYDGDGFGDNWGNSSWNTTRLLGWPGQFVEGAALADHCPTQFGNSSSNGFYGCLDDDGDGIANIYDNLTDEENETAAVDTDLDGVIDSEDMCPDTIVNGTVDATGCLLDSDGDGIVEKPKEESGTYVDSLLAGDSETILKTVGFGAILIAFLGFLQTNIAAVLLPDAFRWVQVLRKKSKLSAEEEQELAYLQSLVQAYYYEPKTLTEELHQLKSDLTARYTNNEIKKTTREKMNTLIADLLVMDNYELERVANNEAYFGLVGTIDTNQRSELLSEELAMRSDTPKPEFGFDVSGGGPVLLQSAPSKEVQGEINNEDNYEYLEHPSGSGNWYIRNSGTGEWDKYHS
jgi:hypothetical protein